MSDKATHAPGSSGDGDDGDEDDLYGLTPRKPADRLATLPGPRGYRCTTKETNPRLAFLLALAPV
jgi:hypothetical protein